MSAFCRDHGISRESFYSVRRRARQESLAGVVTGLSRRPRSSPTAIGDDVVEQVVAVRAWLVGQGLDHGPISIGDRMGALGLAAPSRASIARILARRGLSAVQPRKKPRSAFQRFRYPAPNCLWQADATRYHLATGRACVVFQLIDDHSRRSIASLVAGAETADAAVELLRRGIGKHGVPQKFLSDNGVAFNPSRRGFTGALNAYLTGMGVEMVTGKPGKPTTQGKNERFHQTLFRWLDARPTATGVTELQALVDEFDDYYNDHRPHQGLPGRITPRRAWDLTPTAPPPEPPPLAPSPPTALVRTPSGQEWRTVNRSGAARVHSTHYMLGRHHAGTRVLAIWTLATITFYDAHGTEIIQHERPATPAGYIGNGQPRGFHNPKASGMS